MEDKIKVAQADNEYLLLLLEINPFCEVSAVKAK
jgi:hypothetical protein